MAAVASLVVLVVLTLSAGILHIPAVQDFALERGQGYLLDQRHIDLQSSKLDYNLFRGSSTLHDVVIRGRDAPPDSPPFFTADRVEVNLAITRLVTGSFEVEQARVIGGRLQVVYDVEGRSNVPQFGAEDGPDASAPAKNPEILIGDFRGAGPLIRYADQAAGREVEIADWELNVSGQRYSRAHRIGFRTLRDGRLQDGELNLPLRVNEAELQYSPAKLEINALAVRVGASNLRVEGSATNLSDPVWDLRTRGRIKLAEWASYVGYEDMAGDAEFSGSIRRRWERLLAELRVEATDLGLDDTQTRAEAVINWSQEDRRIALPELTLTSSRGRFDGDATVFFDESETSRARGAFERLDAAFFTRKFGAPYVIGSRASGDLKAQWPGLAFSQAAAEGRAMLRATAEAPREGFFPASGAVRFTRSAAGEINASLDALSALGAKVSGRAHVAASGALAADVEALMDDLGRTVRDSRTLVGSEGEGAEEQELEGPASVNASISGTLDAPVAQVTFRSENLRAGPIEGIAVEAAAAAQKSGVVFESIVAQWQERTMRASGVLGLGAGSPTLDFTASADRFPAEALAAAVGAEEADVAGEVSLEATLAGTIEAPEGSFEVSIDALQAYNEEFGRLTASGSFVDARLLLDEVRIDKPEGGAVQASGSYEVESQTVEVTVAARGLTLAHLDLPGAPSIQGIVSLDANASGSVESPNAAVDIQTVDLVVGDFPAGRIEAAAELRGDTLKWELIAPDFGFQGAGEGPLPPGGPMTFEASLTEFEPTKINPDLPPAVLSGRIAGSVPLDDYAAADVTIELTQARIEAANQEIAAAEPIRLSFRDRRFDIESLTLETSSAKLSASGVLPLEGDSPNGLLVNGNFNLEMIRLLSGKTVDELFLLGLAEIEGVVRGSLRRPRPDVRIALEDAVVFSPATIQPVINADIVAQIGEEGVRLESASAEWTRAQISANGLLPYPLLGISFLGEGDLDQPARLEAELVGLEIDVLEVGPTGFGGEADVKLALEAAELKPEAVTGTIVFPALNLRMRDLELSQSGPATIRFADGEAVLDSFDLTGPESEIVLSGAVRYAPEMSYDLRVDVEADAGIANYLVEDATFRGPAELHATVQGTADEPRFDGSFSLTNGGFALVQPEIAAEDLEIRLLLSRDAIQIERFAGILNGGELEASGLVRLGEEFEILPDLRIQASEVFLEPVEGLRTAARFDLNLTASDDRNLLAGELIIEDGSYRENVDLDSQLGTFLRDTRPVLVEEPNSFLERLNYQIGVRTENPIVVDNNLARMEASLNIRVVGTYYRPSLLGRAVLEEGGEVVLAENEYVIEQGMVEFTNENRIRPNLTLNARTEVAGHQISLRATGPLEDLETQLTSDSGLSEPDIVSLLATGRTLEDARESGVNIAREQALSFLAGNIGGRISRAAESSLGLTEVRIEPNLIAAEGDPSARLTVGQRLTRQLQLIYSMNLTDSNDQIFITEYDLQRRFNARGVKQSDNSYRFDFRHDLRFGLGQQRRSTSEEEARKTIRNIAFSGTPAISEAELHDIVGLEEGKRYDFFKVRGKVDKLVKFYHKQDRLEARVRLRRREEGDQVDLTFHIEAGPIIQFVFVPEEPPGGVRDSVREAWNRGVFETQRIDDAERAVLAWLVSQHYYQAQVDTTIEELTGDGRTGGARRVTVNLEKGARFNELEIRFPGAEGIDPDELREVLDALDLSQRLSARARETSESLERYYAQQGYLDAEVERPDMELDADTLSAIGVIAVNEGPLYRVGAVNFTGVVSLDLDTLTRTLAVQTGNPVYTPEYLDKALETIEEYYWNRGFNDVLVNFLITRRPAQSVVDVEFQIEEGKQDIVRELTITGNKYVGDEFIRRRLMFAEGQGLTPEVTDGSRRRLYRTRAFALVDLDKESIPFESAPPTENSLRVNLGLREVSPYRIRYGGFFDTDRGPGAILDIENRNTLGSARWLGLRARYDQDFKEGRLYFSQPLLHGLPIETTTALFRSRELTDLFITDRTGVSVQQEFQFRRRLIWNYGYRYERTHTFERNPDPLFPFDLTVDVAPLTSSLTFDTRDSLLDATRGRFTSHGFEYAPDTLGSDVRYVKYFGQYFDYFPLIGAKRRPFEARPRKPRLLFATGVRIGMAKGLGGQEVIVSERFLAGGGTTVRGFKQDELGPKDFFGNPVGGDAVFLLNNELRFPMVSVFEGVGFVDLGNVYETAADLDPTDLRGSAGLGLRLRTPFFLLRFDYGWKLDRKPDESRGAFFFSIGQAF